MKRIILTSLFFCLAITTILAQVVTTNIAAPVAGLSTNSVTDFDVNSDGTILNNSAADGTATLGSTAVTANSNITTGSEANLILLQVTGTSGSDLDGTIEVFGGEAGLIIANPNGIDCDGCAFTNVNRVDLVTGSGYDAGTNTFSTIAAADIDITSSGLTAPVLKVQTGADFNNAGAIVADTVTIDVTNFANDIANTGTVSSDSLNLILTANFAPSATAFNAFSFNNLAITTEGYFFNYSDLDLDNLTIKTGANFENAATINAASFTATAGASFNNGFTINADSLNVTAKNFTTNSHTTINATSFTATVGETFRTVVGSVISADSFTVITNNFANSGMVSADSFTTTVEKNFNTYTGSTVNAATVTIEVPNFASNIFNSGTVSSDSLNFILTDNFTHSSTSFTGFINFSNLAITTEGTFTNTINLAGVNLTITANSFNNTGGVVNADTLALSVAGDFDDTKKGTINANYFNLTVGGRFINYNTNDDFVLAENDSLSILGDFTIDTNNYIQFGTLEVSGDLAIDAESDFANSGNITVAGALAIDASRNFANIGNITVTDSLGITAGYTAINQGSIVSESGSLDLTANDFFRNLTGGDIAVASLNITAGGKVTNTANINVEGTLTITANNNSTRDNDPTGFYVSNRGNITATTLNIAAVDNFYNRGNITATNFTTSAKSVFFLNKEIDSYDGIYDGGNISLNGDSSFRADGGIIENYGNIDLGSNNLDISADSFINHASANVTADTLNLTVNSFIQNGSIDATIDQ